MIHVTKEGKKIPIAVMEDNHLLNIIKFYFKKFDCNNNGDLGYILGTSLPKLTPEIYYKLQEALQLYIIEGLRRDSTRQKLTLLLSKWNPIWKNGKNYSHLKNDNNLEFYLQNSNKKLESNYEDSYEDDDDHIYYEDPVIYQDDDMYDIY